LIASFFYLLLAFPTNKKENTISLIQQGIQTEIKRNKNIAIIAVAAPKMVKGI